MKRDFLAKETALLAGMESSGKILLKWLEKSPNNDEVQFVSQIFKDFVFAWYEFKRDLENANTTIEQIDKECLIDKIRMREQAVTIKEQQLKIDELNKLLGL